jgi:predicted nucleic-acid-binding protein
VTVSGSLDTNVLLRLLLDDIPHQSQAAKMLLEETPGQFTVADVAIVEVIFVLERYYNFARQHIVTIVDGLAAVPAIDCNRALLEKALPIFLEHQSLSFEDCCLAVYANLNDTQPLWTFDKKLAKQAPFVKLVPVAG